LATHYRTAQIIDERMGLYDAISTAVYFESNASRSRAAEEIRRLQAEQAERIAEGVDVRLAVPFAAPRTLYAMAALALVASSLFALRFGLTRRLDLKAPLATILQQRLGYQERNHVAKNNRREQPPPGESADTDVLAEAEERSPGEPFADPIASDEAPPAQAEAKGNKADARKQGDEGENPEPEAEPVEEESEDSDDSDGNGNAGTNGNAKGDPKQDSGARPDGDANDSSSLLNKLKDAMQNLISKVKIPNQAGPQNASDPNGKQSKSQQGKQQSASKDGQQQSGQQSEGQEGEASEQAQNSQDSQGKNTGKNDSQQTTKQPGSGVGSQDGDKSIKQAEQLAAMGKISEIIGKRSASLSGEATVEVQSTRQTLHTPYAQRGAQHTQGGAEISRDEVPVALQSYVQRYFEHVRKQVPAAGKK
jgi:hypothetical protein